LALSWVSYWYFVKALEVFDFSLSNLDDTFENTKQLEKFVVVHDQVDGGLFVFDHAKLISDLLDVAVLIYLDDLLDRWQNLIACLKLAYHGAVFP